MGEFFSKLGQGNIFWLVVVSGIVLYGLGVSIVQAWRRIRLAEIEASLKHQMLEKEMSADEIERILRASSRSGGSASDSSSETDEGRVELVQNLAENGMSSEDIERILRAMQRPNAAATVQEAVAVKA
jgi:hypothetical protein